MSHANVHGKSLIKLLAFISSFDEVVVALFLAGANMTLPKKMFDNILMEIDPTIVRLLFVLGLFAGGATFWAYLVMMLVVPEEL